MAGTGAGVLPVQQNGQFMGGSAMPMGYGGNNFYAPNPLPTTPIQGTGHWVSQGAQFLSGLQAGSNFMGNLQQARRGQQMYQGVQRAGQKGNAFQTYLVNRVRAKHGEAPLPVPSTTEPMPGTQMLESAGHAIVGIPHDIGAGIGHVVSGVENMFEGGGVVPDFMSAPPEGAMGGGVLPASTQGQMPPIWAPGSGSRAFMAGGVVPSAAGAPGAGGNGAPPPAMAAMMMAQSQGQGGAAAGPPPSVPTPPPGNGLPTPGAQPAAAPAPAGAVPPPAQQGMQAAQNPGIVGRFEAWAHHLFHGGAMQGVGQKSAIPSQSGAPAHGSGPAHSLTPEWFDQGDQLALQAAAGAAEAGQDPLQVFNALQNQRTSFLQSHFVRDLSTANAALMSGDQKGAEAAIRSAYYYIPNGQEIKFSKNAQGQTVFEDPLETGPDGKPKLVPLDPTTVGMIGQAALSPTTFGGYINQVKILSQEAQGKYLTGLGQLYRGKGIYQSGLGADVRALAEQARVPYENALAIAEAQRAKLQATAASLLLHSFGNAPQQLQRNVAAAIQFGQNMLLGPKAQQDPNSFSPAAGKIIHDTSKVAPWLAHLSADDQNQFMVYTSGFAASGAAPADAAQYASLVYKLRGQSHPAKGDPSPLAVQYEKAHPGAKLPDVMQGTNAQGQPVIHFWTGKGWKDVPYNPSGQTVFAPNGSYQQMLMRLATAPTYGYGGYPAPGGAGAGGPNNTAMLDATYGGSAAP